MISRRSFLKSGAMVALAAAIPAEFVASAAGQRALRKPLNASPFFPIPHLSQIDPMAYLTMAAFTPYVKTVFRIRTAQSQVMPVTLVEVTDTRTVADKKKTTGKISAADGKECFSLYFRGSKRVELPQGTYKIDHDALGRLSLFIVPIDKNGSGYEAVINRMTP